MERRDLMYGGYTKKKYYIQFLQDIGTMSEINKTNKLFKIFDCYVQIYLPIQLELPQLYNLHVLIFVLEQLLFSTFCCHLF